MWLGGRALVKALSRVGQRGGGGRGRTSGSGTHIVNGRHRRRRCRCRRNRSWLRRRRRCRRRLHHRRAGSAGLGVRRRRRRLVARRVLPFSFMDLYFKERWFSKDRPGRVGLVLRALRFLMAPHAAVRHTGRASAIKVTLGLQLSFREAGVGVCEAPLT